MPVAYMGGRRRFWYSLGPFYVEFGRYGFDLALVGRVLYPGLGNAPPVRQSLLVLGVRWSARGLTLTPGVWNWRPCLSVRWL